MFSDGRRLPEGNRWRRCLSAGGPGAGSFFAGCARDEMRMLPEAQYRGLDADGSAEQSIRDSHRGQLAEARLTISEISVISHHSLS